jgi:hypothetical protein
MLLLKRPLAAGCLLLFLLTLAPERLVAVPPVFRALQVRIVAKDDPGAPGKMYWALIALPTEEDIRVTDSSMRLELSKALKTLGKQNVKEWNLKDSAPDNFKTRLQIAISPAYRFTLQPPPSPNAPTDRNPQTVTLDAAFIPNIVPAVVRNGLTMRVVVTGSRVISQNPVRTTLGILAGHGVPGLTDLTEEEKAVPVRVGDATSQGTETTWQESPEHSHAYEAAVLAFSSARKNALQQTEQNFGSTSGDVLTEIRNALSDRFDLTATWETVLPDKTKDLVIFEEKTKTWIISIPLHTVDNVKFQFSAIQTEGKEIPWDSYPYAGQLADKKTSAEGEVEKKVQPEFASLRGKLLTRDELEGRTKPILDALEHNRSVIHAIGPGSQDYDLVFTGVWLPNETDFTAGVGYSTDKGVGGKIGLTSRNLPLVKHSLLDFGVEAGTEKQGGHLSYTLPDYYKSADGRLSSQLDLTAEYKRDRDQKLGAPDSPGVREERATGALKNVLRFTANPAATGGENSSQSAVSGYGATLETTLGYSKTQLGASSDQDPEVQDGSVFFALANLQQRWWRDFQKPETPGIGKVEILWQLHGKKGFTAGLGDFDFFSADSTITLTAYFGSESSRDFFIRLLGGGAISSGNIPIFEQFRLGGDTTVRGLEDGERLARDAVFDSMEVGVRTGRVWQWISRERAKAPLASQPASSASQSAPSVGGLDLGNSYVSLFFDHAYIARSSTRSGADGLTPNLESVGAAFEIPLPTSAVQGRLRIGYAWSPQSIHEQGRCFVSATLDFP